MRILVAEDDDALRSVIERGLTEAGYVVDAVPDGDVALAYLDAYEYEVVVLDWRMPHVSGIDVLGRVRAGSSGVPVLMLTARDAPADRVAGLDAGADDYLVKPFDFAELLARLRALRRRPATSLQPVLECGNLSLEPSTRQATIAGRPLLLTQTELAILELLLERSPSIVSRQSIAIGVWQHEADAVGSNTIDVHVGRLRQKLRSSSVRIETVRGTGYRLSGQSPGVKQ